MTTDGSDQFLDPGYLSGLSTLSLVEVRERRSACSEVEVGLSYLRRLVQGRLDIVLAEVGRRESGGGPVELADLVEQLPRILGDHVHAPGAGRLSTVMAPSVVDEAGQEKLDRILSPERVGRLGELPDDDLAAVAEQLQDFEREVSQHRRALHDVLDRLQEEVVRRYKSGEATVDSLLN